MNTLIFADVHLKVSAAGETGRTEFVTFLRSIDPAECDRVIILGDLFDFWFEYRHVIFSGYFGVLRAFADLRDSGVEFHLVCGNHDFWAGRFLEEHLGFTIHRESYRCTMGDRRVLFVHGDGINPSDIGYRIFKRVARARLVIRLFRLFHPDWAMALAQGVSHTSRRLLAPEDPRQSKEVKAARNYARQVLSNGSTDVLLCAHTHHPVEEDIDTPSGPKTYINTGDWLDHRTYLQWDGAAFERKYFRPPDEDADAAR